MMDMALIALGVLLAVQAIRSHRQLLHAMRPHPLPPRLEHYPSVTVIRPIKGLDCEVEQNIRAGLDTGYPGDVQTLFVLDDVNEPALPIVEKVLARRRESGIREEVEILFCGAPPADRTGKLNAMLAGLTKATGRLVAFADSDIRTDRDTLRIMVETLLTTDRAGSAFPAVTVSEPPRTAGDVGIAMMLNSLYSPLSEVLAAESGGELPFILGQYMVFTRKTLDTIRLGEMRGQLVDDLHMGALVREQGLRNVIAPCRNRIVQYGYGPRQAFELYCRWMMYSRAGMPEWSYKLPTAMRAVVYLLGLFLGSAALLAGSWLAAGLLLGSAALVNYTMLAIHRQIGGAPIPARYWLVPGTCFLLMPAVFYRIYTTHRLDWRGRTYRVEEGRLHVDRR